MIMDPESPIPPSPKKERQSSRNKRTPAQRETDKAQIRVWYLEGWGLREMAEELGKRRNYTLSHNQVHADVQKVKDDLVEALNLEAKGHIARMLASMERREQEYWKAYRASQRTAVKKHLERQGGRMVLTREEREKIPGDARILDSIGKLDDARRSIIGLDQPKRQVLSDPKGDPISFVVRLGEDEIP